MKIWPLILVEDRKQTRLKTKLGLLGKDRTSDLKERRPLCAWKVEMN